MPTVEKLQANGATIASVTAGMNRTCSSREKREERKGREGKGKETARKRKKERKNSLEKETVTDADGWEDGIEENKRAYATTPLSSSSSWSFQRTIVHERRSARVPPADCR